MLYSNPNISGDPVEPSRDHEDGRLGHDDVEGDPAAAREPDGAEPRDLQVLHRQRNPHHPRSDGPGLEDRGLPVPGVGVERLKPGGAGSERDQPHLERHPGDRQFLSGKLPVPQRPRLRRGDNGPGETSLDQVARIG